MKNINASAMILLAIYGIFAQSCVPVFSELQSARTVGKGNLEFTPSYSSTSMTLEEETEKVQNNIGFQAAYGITERFDLRFRYEYAWLKDNEGEGEGAHIIGIGPKVALLPDYISVAMPIGTALGDGYEDTWEIHPTLLLSAPIMKDKIELNVAPKYLVTLCDDCEDAYAFNFGLALSSNLDRWAIRPEYGLLYINDDEGHYSHFSIGFSATLAKHK